MIVGFFADQCGPCRCVPGSKSPAPTERGIGFGRVDVWAEPALAERFGISASPTLLVLPDGAVVTSHAGPCPTTAWSS